MAALEKNVKVLVVGAGAMGSGIAQIAARAGHTVYLYDGRTEAIAAGRAAIEKDLKFLVAKGKLDAAEAEATLARVVPVAILAGAEDAGLAIEAIVENLEVKRKLFSELEGLLAEDAILASNTSSLSINAMAAGLARPGRIAGLHFFNPAPRMALVEVISGLNTEREVAECLYDTAREWGKMPVHAASTPGFIVNRVARPYYAEALRVLAEHEAEPATLDAILREGCGFAMGPFELIDLIGHDINFAVTKSVFEAYFCDRRYAPSQFQQELVAAGRLGRKTGRGIYEYGELAAKPVPQDEPPQEGESRITVVGDIGAAAPLLARLEAAGIEVRRESGMHGRRGWMQIGAARVALTDGRTATYRAVEEHCPNLVLFDLCLDYSVSTRIGLTRADQCGLGAMRAVVGTFQRAGFKVSVIDDVAGLIALRTVAMLANEAADAVLQGVASARDVDTAMRYGTNYPKGGPLAWADMLGAGFVVDVLANLKEHYGEERYRVSPLLRRKAYNGEALYD
ncbi:MAG TPA: 3-hydroxyacyl-CoA dehydrogenase PaaH [Aromatoleum sp.]|uniref:3-hydroxyacyl-CoA dehydrogenase PaaH n=1 Tax=Aromatoleum sp. TaxID=2307007 RepID=UPI002B4AA8CB|nr:3-hydroxyacyl-CoA dehydrogenase PaaH [Aromatoleum sp.]HJV25410.1 3-hydroxyacyl-CoA dehydrogenase PaaH [Aromatoleum sp.]